MLIRYTLIHSGYRFTITTCGGSDDGSAFCNGDIGTIVNTYRIF